MTWGRECGLRSPPPASKGKLRSAPMLYWGDLAPTARLGHRGACPGRGACSLREEGGAPPGSLRHPELSRGRGRGPGGGVPGGGGAVRSSDPHPFIRHRPRPFRAGLLRSLCHPWSRSAYLMPSCFSAQTNPACVCSFASSLLLVLACPASGYVSLLRPVSKTRASSVCPIFI